jgi:hypothetical protein
MKSFTIVAGAFVVALAACKSNPSRDVQDARTQLTSAYADRAGAQQRLEARQSQETYEAQQSGVKPSELREMQARHARERQELSSKGQESVDEAQKETTKAHDELLRERADVHAKYQQRLVELDKKAHDAHARSGDFAPAKKSEFDQAWFTYTAEHRNVEGTMSALGKAPDAEFGTWRDRTSAQLDQLERAVGTLDDMK